MNPLTGFNKNANYALMFVIDMNIRNKCIASIYIACPVSVYVMRDFCLSILNRL